MWLNFEAYGQTSYKNLFFAVWYVIVCSCPQMMLQRFRGGQNQQLNMLAAKLSPKV